MMCRASAERDTADTLVHFTSEEENFNYFLRSSNPEALHLPQPTGTILPSPCHLRLAIGGHGQRRMASLVTERPLGERLRVYVPS